MPRERARRDPQLGAAIRKRRKQVQMTLQALCDRSGVSVGYLSQVERDNATPSLGTLAQIADALGVALEYFIAAPKPSDGLTRAGQRPQFSLAHSSLTYESLAADFPGSELSSYLLHVPPGYVSETVSHEGEEMIFVLEGEIEQTLDNQSFRMKAGDCLHYSGQTAHAWSNPTEKTARILWAGTLTVLTRAGAIELPELAHKI
ncbi:MAG: XRE family transcriptional regulator [Marinovum algicola]|jgi:transcriptional regulator with XRE-family HTH domain|uniref:Transcriptional regulator, XRE family with cupin sensor n=1 Tax=Marinovum algicola TaxID=42444 RepID=A0A975ZP24_9RHOB|nr:MULTISPECIES: XRE family transcriptional regulator [Marinovum]AKO99465.1 putative transcriptional regulator [Marinovum algicola DG 898]MDD9743906.1 XRE family transcriptional regulator [Marinovum sp. PR37]SEJ73586.1 transcriptional regulator, XRE family with cupin sensor [Marinovum algicola]SLN56969.1 HTH-type transcriptional regulator PuuR [Marinovum algicola]